MKIASKELLALFAIVMTMLLLSYKMVIPRAVERLEPREIKDKGKSWYK